MGLKRAKFGAISDNFGLRSRNGSRYRKSERHGIGGNPSRVRWRKVLWTLVH